VNTFFFNPLFGVFDQAPILNMHQFDGEYGCPVCLHPGQGNPRIYTPGMC